MYINYNDKIFLYDLFENFIFSISQIIQGLLSRPSSNEKVDLKNLKNQLLKIYNR